jgi:hypothetical protein
VLPDVVREGVVSVLIRRWTPEDGQEAAVEEAAAARRAAWPDGLVSFSGYAETSGDGVFTYEQWATPQPGEDEYHLHRHRVFAPDVVPGCVVLVAVELEDPEAPLRWVDTVFGAFDEQRRPAAGLRGAFFHLRTGDPGVVNYAEWASEAAYDAASFSNSEAIADSPKLREVRDFPGVRSLVVRRYRPLVSLTGPHGPVVPLGTPQPEDRLIGKW